MAFKEALFYRTLPDKKVNCQLCPHSCIIENGTVGKCRVRQNINGKLKTLVYGKPCSVAFDPIEKKPLYHFIPNSRALSIATVGCNLTCKHCQNAEISQATPEDIPSLKMTPTQIVKEAKQGDAKIIAYTYTEPTIFYEYMHEIAEKAKKDKIKNITITNGFISPEPLKKLCKYLDATNVDIKSMNPEFYTRICGARLEPVLESLKIMKEKGVWIEITNLIIPGLNDTLYEVRKLISWVLKNLGADVPIHFTAFFPTNQLKNVPKTTAKELKRARKIALDAGLKYVYTGNIQDEEGNTTYCPKCRRAVIIRQGFHVIKNNLVDGKCHCGEKIPGVWK